MFVAAVYIGTGSVSCGCQKKEVRRWLRVCRRGKWVRISHRHLPNIYDGYNGIYTYLQSYSVALCARSMARTNDDGNDAASMVTLKIPFYYYTFIAVECVNARSNRLIRNHIGIGHYFRNFFLLCQSDDSMMENKLHGHLLIHFCPLEREMKSYLMAGYLA